MFKFIKNKFLFIVLISVVTLVILVVGALTLYEDPSLSFLNEGYIIETTSKTNNKYYFSANTKYKENVDEQITFSDSDSKQVVVDPASFVHYLNGNVSFLKRGALVNLAEINSPMISYYNITNQNTIVYENGQYIVTSNGKKINIESFVGRINDNKYLIAGKNLSIKIPSVEDRINGDYFEILFIEEGIVKIDNQEASYQVAAQDTYLYVGDKITISLGDGKIFFDGDAKMLLSQITINGDENINLDVEDPTGGGGGGGGGSGSGTGDGDGEGDSETEGDGKGSGGSGSGDGEGEGSGGGSGDGTGEGDGEGGSGSGGNGVDGPGSDSNENGLGTGGASGDGSGGSGDGGSKTTASPKIELIEASVTATTIDLSLQLNNADLATGEIVAYLTNVSTGQRAYSKYIDLVNGTFKIGVESLSPSTEYALTIVETGNEKAKQYFQKTFRTNELGITLEKVYATDNSLSYKINFDENSEVTETRIVIYDNNGTNDSIEPSEYTVKKTDLNHTVVFSGLKSNTSHSVSIDTVLINNAAYSNVYTINRIDTTLKKTPVISNVTVDANAEEVKFTIGLENITDPDKSIISYTYNVYLANDITAENLDPQVVYSITKNDADDLVLNLNEIDELKTGVDYRCKIVAQYNDNEMIREVSTDYSGNFLIKSKPNISFELESATMNKVIGTITLVDANCTVPINGRSCSNLKNNFTLRYYKLKEEETTENDRSITFSPDTLTSELELTELASNTTYAVKVFGDYYDDDNILHSNVQIGDTFYVTTDKSENLYLEIIGDNISGHNKDGTENSANVVTFDARLTAPQDSDIIEEISTVTLNLYSGRYNVKEKLIGTYTVKDKTAIQDMFNNITVRNPLFTDTTQNKLGNLDTLQKLITVTNNTTGTLNSSYTVEVENVYDSTGINKITVENNVYTFNLTPSYYLDTRIETNPSYSYVTTTLITKENLTEEEYEDLSKDVKNLDELNDDTVVGLTLENSLSDIFVDSAFTYEKVIVDYIIYNNTTKREIKRVSVDMGNKYQPKTQTIYLDSSELDDGIKYFTRGYNYKFGYVLNFITEDGSNPVYDHEKLHKTLAIQRQSPLYTQYISSSTSTGITYRYSFKDIDNALAEKKFYYTLGEDKENYKKVEGLVANNEYHEVTIPISKNTDYKLYYPRKNTSNETEYISISEYHFETEYDYDKQNAYTIINDKDNVLKLRLEKNAVTDRAAAYRVEITANDNGEKLEYTKYFLASRLNKTSYDTGKTDEEGNAILEEYKYIAIDYANISRFMGLTMNIKVYSYYDSGLVGLDQPFNHGLTLKNSLTNKFLNIYNEGSSKASVKEDNDLMGIYRLREEHKKGDSTISLYNLLLSTDKYNSLLGANYYKTTELNKNVGIDFGVTITNAGFLLDYEKKSFQGYNARVLKEAELNSEKNTHKFDAIVPKVKVTTNNSTINSVKVQIVPTGIYGKKQFVKAGASHNKIYVDFYADELLENKLTTITTDITISGSDETGYTATIEELEYKELLPATKYYFTISAWINGEYTRLYDNSSTTSYITKTYEGSTLDDKGILENIAFSVLPTAYKGETSEKKLTWRLGLKNTENYKIRFELYEPTDTSTKTDEETGETITIQNYQPIKFDGTPAISCDNTKTGSSSDGYVENCYISVDKNNIASINKKNQTYKFTGNSFVFGGNYYKLEVYAIPYTNDKYDEEHKLLLFQREKLSTTGAVTENGLSYNITIPTLEEASFSLKSLTSDYSAQDGYYISFIPVITDTHYVTKYGTYTITLKDATGSVVDRKTGVDASVVNPSEVRFTGLSSNTLYYIEMTHETYRNNYGLTEDQKDDTIPFTDFTYTPVAASITLGTITATQISARNIMLTYNGSSNLSKQIVKVSYTISLKGGSSKTSGTYAVDADNSNIFEIGTDSTPRLMIDTTDSGFTFKSGNTYIITTQYYYMNNGKEELLEDQENKNSNYTTILNL